MDATNQLIDNLPRKGRRDFLDQCEPVELVFGDLLQAAGSAAEHVFFPRTGFVSLVAQGQGTPSVEVGMVGSEGMLGTHLALGVDWSAVDATVQGSGTAMRMTTESFARELRDNAGLDGVLRRYTCFVMGELASQSPCMRFHSISQRLARWLLMSQDRAGTNVFRCTHEYLAWMLGVRRAGVTVAAGRLQKARLIHYSRGMITIIDRAGLEAAACNCYAMQCASYERIMQHGESH